MPDSSITFAEMREHLYSAAVADALDELGWREQSPRVPLSPLTIDTVVVGRCRTTLWGDLFHPDPAPYALEMQAVDACQPDDVFIAAAMGSMRSGIWGELLSTAAHRAGCQGAIVDGAVRDVRATRQLGFPVFARGTSVYDSRDRQRVVDIDIAVDIGGVTFRPGDLVIADSDGIVVVPQSVEQDTMERAWKKVTGENQVRDAIRKGMKVRDAFDQFGIL